MNKRILIAAGATVLVALLAVGAYLFLAKPGTDSKRANILKLAQDYAQQGSGGW